MATPSAVLTDLSNHLHAVESEPTTLLDTDLLEQCELYVSTPEYQSQSWKDTRPLFLQIAALLPTLQQDPTALVHLIIKLAGPYRFEDIKDVDFEIALDLQASPFHGLILSLLDKATASGADTQALANRPGVVAAIVRLWLCTPDTQTATQAENLLVSLLRASKNEPVSVGGEDTAHTYGTGPMWRRLFNDRDIRSLYYYHTSLKQLSSPPQPFLSKRNKTIAQARLLAWLPRVGSLHWDTLVASHTVDVEREIGLRGDQGLIYYAATKMVDTDDDVVMHMTLIDFFSVLITTIKTCPHLTQVYQQASPICSLTKYRHYNSSLSLDFLQKYGLHKKLVDIHTTENPGAEHSFLSSRTAQYISDYASNYPENFEKSLEMPTIRNHVYRNIRRCEAQDLNIIASLPRSTLVPRRGLIYAWDECVVLDMPITRTNQDALKTLATIFHGPPKEEITFPQVEVLGSDATRKQTESAFARLLTALFISKKPNMFSDIIRHADTVAIKENALAALTLLRALITASWSTEHIPDIPSNDTTYARLSDFPKTGLDLILDPSISGGVLPALLKPATSFSNLVGGRGDAENAAYQVAVAKFDVLKALGRQLEENGGREDVLFMVKRRVNEGPWGVSGSVGSRIGTLEL